MIIVTTVELLCALALAIVAHMTYYEQTYQSNMTDDFIKSWSAKPIVDVIAIDEAQCPAGYERLVADSWQGTANGCYCPQEDKIEKATCADMLDNVMDFFRDE